MVIQEMLFSAEQMYDPQRAKLHPMPKHLLLEGTFSKVKVKWRFFSYISSAAHCLARFGLLHT
jgi:hypothetical protein